MHKHCRYGVCLSLHEKCVFGFFLQKLTLDLHCLFHVLSKILRINNIVGCILLINVEDFNNGCTVIVAQIK